MKVGDLVPIPIPGEVGTVLDIGARWILVEFSGLPTADDPRRLSRTEWLFSLEEMQRRGGRDVNAQRSPLIWWVAERDYDELNILSLWEAGVSLYVAQQFNDAEGRPGRGRLWADERFREIAVEPWPKSHRNSGRCLACAGIVVASDDAKKIKAMFHDAFITDFALESMAELS